MVKKVKIEFFKAKDCQLCLSAERLLRLILAEKGLEYGRVVQERHTDSSPEDARLGSLYLPNIPVIKIGKQLLKGEAACNEYSLRRFLSDNGYC